MQQSKKLIVIGGGPAGFFAAIRAAQLRQDLQICILEQGNHVLGKVKISGGGRCNVTNNCEDISTLVKFYPRGQKELFAPFKQFNCMDTMSWFEARHVALKTENDGRVFPVSDDSQTIIDCILQEAKKHGIEVKRNCKVMSIEHSTTFKITCIDEVIDADYVLLASGSNDTLLTQIKSLGHTIIEPVPSLFTFKTKNTLFRNLSGVTLSNCSIQIEGSKISQDGIVLITHEGLSGPAVLKLSAFGARYLAESNYQFTLIANWINTSIEIAFQDLMRHKNVHAKKKFINAPVFQLPTRFWENTITELKINPDKLWADINKDELQQLAKFLCQCPISIHGKSTNKEEFVTAGGVSLKEINFKTMESKLIPNLYFAGEVLDIDAVTGGFNFQACWTTAWVAATAIGGGGK